ncbi:MAG: flagellar filament capping protein FliD, partial [Lachnospiraceae bacterium]|nr:flagellar filament capping protein FliD [Lachnospiraceae bacterium]
MAIRLSGMASGLDTEAMVQELVSSYNIKKESYQKEQTRMEWKQEKWKDLNSKIYKFYTGSLSNMKLTSAFNKKKTVASDANKATVLAASNAVTGTQSLVIKELASSGYLTGAEIAKKDGGKVTAGTKFSELGIKNEHSIEVKLGNGKSTTININPDTTVSEFVSSLKGAGLNASFDEKNQRFFVSSKESGEAGDFELSCNKALLSKLGLNEDDGAKKLDGKDAVIELNGAEFKSSNNTFSINGLTIEVKEKSEVLATDADGNPTQYAATTLSTSMDVDAVYDMVKDFLKEYNELIKEMDKLYGADSSRGYDPLTSEEKEAMTEEEIEKWESKIKDSLLRRDTTVSSITNMLKNTMAGTYEIDGKNYSLSSFGINTLSYFIAGENEKGVYHIDGDKD